MIDKDLADLNAADKNISQQPVPQQTGGYSLLQLVDTWDAGYKRCNNNWNGLPTHEIDNPDKLTYLSSIHPSPTAPSDAIECMEFILKKQLCYSTFTASELYEIFKQRTTT